jgi:hypothetical protein
MAQVFLYPAPDQSPLDEDGNPFPSTGLRVTMNAYYEGQCRQGLLVRSDPNAFSSVVQPAVYAPVSLGYVTTQLSAVAGLRDGQYLTTTGYGAAGDDGGATWRFSLGVSAGENGITKINCGNGQWAMVLAYNGVVSTRQLGCKDDDGVTDNGALIMAYLDIKHAEAGANGGSARLYHPPARFGRAFGTSTTITARGITAPGGKVFRVYITGDGANFLGSDPYGYPSWTVNNGTGSVFRVMVDDIDCFSGDLVNLYGELHVEGIGVVGTGRGTGAGIRVQGAGNCLVTTRGNYIVNCYTGIYHRNGISCKNHEQNIIYSCFIGDDFDGTIDMLYLGQRTEACNIGMWLREGYNLGVIGGTAQGCAVGLAIGDGLGWGDASFMRVHFETNGWIRTACVTATTVNDTLSGLAARSGVAIVAGNRVLVTGQTDKTQNGPYIAAAGAWSRADTAVTTHAGCCYEVTGGTAIGWWEIDNTAPAFLTDGDELDVVQLAYRDWDIRVDPSGPSQGAITFTGCTFAQNDRQILAANMRFEDCSGFELVGVSGGYADCSRSGPLGATDWTIATSFRFNPPYRPPHNATVTGSYTHDWANWGMVANLLVNGNTTIEAPTNMCEGAKLFVRVKLAGNYRVTLSGSIYGAQEWSNLRGVTSAESSIELSYENAQWKISTPQVPYWYGGSIASFTATNPPAQGTTPLDRPTNRVTVVANANDSVTLPDASDVIGLGPAGVLVINDGVNTLQIYPASGDDLGFGVNTSTTLAAGQSRRYVALSANLLRAV